MRATTEAFVYAFSGTWTPDSAALHARALDCEHHILPSSLGIPKRSNEEWRTYFKQLEGVVTDAEVGSNPTVLKHRSNLLVGQS